MLVALDVVGVDRDDDLCVICQGHEHANLGIRLEPGQHARGMVVIEELAAELEVELAAKLGNAFSNARGLHLDIHVIVESGTHAIQPFASSLFFIIHDSNDMKTEPMRRIGWERTKAVSHICPHVGVL